MNSKRRVVIRERDTEYGEEAMTLVMKFGGTSVGSAQAMAKRPI
ncbi:MAG: hypothetical protein R3E31_01750 [Chloroflexota bacterium]